MSQTLSFPAIGADTVDALEDAFTSLRLESSSPSLAPSGTQDSPSRVPEDPLLTRRRHSEHPQSSRTAQSCPPVPERRSTLPELWADPNALYTMTCLEGQFVKVLGRNPSRLTIDDFEELYRAKFRELNEEILGDNLCFVEAMQAYEREYREHQEHVRIMRMQQAQQRHHMEMYEQHHHHQQQQEQELFDSHYAASMTSPTQTPYMYSSSGPLNPIAADASKTRPASMENSHSHVDMDHSSMRPHSQIQWSPAKLPPSDATQELPALTGPRSSSWSSPFHYTPMSADMYSRPRGNSHADFPRQTIADPTLVYYSTHSHGSSSSVVSSASSHFPAHQLIDPPPSLRSEQKTPQ